MKVSELFAEIGFKVDTKGLNDFSNSMKAIQETIKGCMAGLKEFAKAANDINKAVEKMKTSYIPSKQEAERRYRAETYYLRSAGKELRNRAYLEGARGNVISSISSESKTISEGVTIGTIIGNIVSRAISGLFSQLKGFISGVLSFVKDTIRAAMAYRDYRTFTGRSVNELSGLMGMTAYTTSMTPQDVLRDAQGFQKQYWDMWFGKASPEAWMRLGIMPTGNGARDLRSVLRGIYNASDRGTNTGFAASLLSTFGLDEQYMNIFKAMREGRENEFIVMDEQIDKFEQANNALNEFSLAIDEAKRAIVETLLNSGLKEMLDYLVDVIKTIVILLRGGAFKDKSFGESLDIIGGVLNSGSGARSGMQKTGQYLGRTSFSVWEGIKAAAIGALTLDFLHSEVSDALVLGLSGNRGGTWEPPQIINNFDFQNRTTDELADGVSSVNAKQLYLRDQINTTYATEGSI